MKNMFSFLKGLTNLPSLLKITSLFILLLCVGLNKAVAAASTTSDNSYATGTITFENVGTISSSTTYWYNGIKIYSNSTGKCSKGGDRFTADNLSYPAYVSEVTAGNKWGSYSMSGLLIQCHALAVHVQNNCTIEVIVDCNSTSGSNLSVVYDTCDYGTNYSPSTYKTGTKISITPTQSDNTKGRYVYSIPVEGEKVVKLLYNSSGTGAGKLYLYESVRIIEGGTTSSYTITYQTNGGTSVDQATGQTKLPDPLPTTTKTGYTLEGWYTDANFTTKVTVGGTLTKDTTLYAHWTENKYTLSYDANTPNPWSLEESKIPYTVASMPTNASDVRVTTVSTTTPTCYEKESTNYAIYTFKEWNTKANGSGTSYAAGADITLTENTTLYAQWTAEEFAITYYDGDTKITGLTPDKYTYGTDVKFSTTPTKEGYTFKAWRQTSTTGAVVTSTGTNFINFVLYAEWEAITVTTYTVTYNANEGTCTTTSQTYTGTALTLPTPTRDGYTFTGWFTDATSGTQVSDPYTPTANITLYAHWELIPTEECNYIVNETTLSVTKGYDFGKQVLYIKNKDSKYSTSTSDFCSPAKYCYYADTVIVQIKSTGSALSAIRFQGKHTGNRSVSNVEISDALDGTYTELTGYTTIDYTASDCGELGISGVNIPAGKFVKFYFSGEFRISGLCVENSSATPVTTYTVTYNANGGNCDPTSATYTDGGTALTLPTPTYTGYTFQGWYDADNKKIGNAGDYYTPTANITLYAKWITTSATTEACNTLTITSSATSYDLGNQMLYNGKNGGSNTYYYTSSPIVQLKNKAVTGIRFNGQQDYDVSIDSVYTATSYDGPYTPLTVFNATTYKSKSDGVFGISGVNIPAGSYVKFKFKGGTKNEFRIKGLCVDEINATDPSYTFHYGEKGGSGYQTLNFVQVGSTNEWQITDFIFPDVSTNQASYVGKGEWKDSGLGSNNAKSADCYLYDMPLAPLQGSSCTNQVVGWEQNSSNGHKAIGTLRIYDNSTADNLYIGFIPNGYGLMHGVDGSTWGDGLAFSKDENNTWTTAEITLTDEMLADTYKYYVGLLTSDGKYTYCGNSETSVLSSMGTYANGTWGNNVNTYSAGQHGVFRMWDNSCNDNNTKNFVCHFVPYYAVVYNANYPFGVSGAPADTYSDYVSSEATQTLTLAAAPTAPAGYTFKGWYDAATDGKLIGNANESYSFTKPTANITLYAHWEAQQTPTTGCETFVIFDGTNANAAIIKDSVMTSGTFTTTIKANGGSISDVGTSRTNNINSKTYSKFESLSTTSKNKSYISFTVPTGYTATLDAVFAANGNSRKIVLASVIVTSATDEAVIDTLASFPSSGGSKTLLAYNGELSAGTYYICGFGGSWGIVDLSIKLCASSNVYTVTYNNNDGTGTTTKTTYSGTELTLPTITRDGYTFNGWYSAATEGELVGDAGDKFTPESDTTLYAQWQLHACTVIAAAAASSKSTMTPSVGDVSLSSSKDGSESPLSIRLSSDDAYIQLTPKAGFAFQIGDEVKVTMYASGKKTIGFKLGETSYTTTTTAAGTITLSATLTSKAIESGIVKIYRGSSETYFVSVEISQCTTCADDIPMITTTSTTSGACDETIELKLVASDGTTAVSAGTVQWYRNDNPIDGANGYTYTATMVGTYYATLTVNCEVQSSNTAVVESQNTPALEKVVDKRYVHDTISYNAATIYPLFDITSKGTTSDGKQYDTRVTVRRGTTTVATSVAVDWLREDSINTATGYIALGANYPLLQAWCKANNLAIGDSIFVWAAPVNGCNVVDTKIFDSIPIVITHRRSLGYIVTGTVKGSIFAVNSGNLSDKLYTGLQDLYDVTPLNAYAAYNYENYAAYDLLLLTDYPNANDNKTKSYVDALADLVDRKPVLSLKAHMAKLDAWKAKGFTSNPIVPGTNVDKSSAEAQKTLTVLCFSHEMFTGATWDNETDRTITILDSVAREKGTEGSYKGLQGFEAAAANDFMNIATIYDSKTKQTLIACCERQNVVEARFVMLSVNRGSTKCINDKGIKMIDLLLEYLLETDPNKVSDCALTFDNGGTEHRTGSGDGLWGTAANWTDGVIPTQAHNVRIEANCTVSGKVYEVANVRLNKNYTITIEPDAGLASVGKFASYETGHPISATPITDPTRITVKADDSHTGLLIHANEDQLAATVQMYSPAHYDATNLTTAGNPTRYWAYVAIPVESAPVPANFFGAYTYLWDESVTACWTRYGDGTTLPAWGGIGLSQEKGETFTLSGNLMLATPHTFTLTNTSGSQGQGMNLIGNSWTAPLQIAKLDSADFGEGLERTIYLYNTGRDPETGAFVGSYDNKTAGQWMAIPIRLAAQTGYAGPKVIPAMQAFEVNFDENATQTSASFTLDYEKLVRASSYNSDFNQKLYAPKRVVANEYEDEEEYYDEDEIEEEPTPTIEPIMLRLQMESNTKRADLYLLQGESFHAGYDAGWDGYYMGGDDRAVGIYALTESGEMEVSAQPQLAGTTLGTITDADDDYLLTFTFTGGEGNYPVLYLNDMQQRQSTLIDNDAYYSFRTAETDILNRFVISDQPLDTQITTDLTEIVSDGENYLISNPAGEQMHIAIYDAAGRLCGYMQTADTMIQLEMPAAQGVYMVHAQGEHSQKVVKIVR